MGAKAKDTEKQKPKNDETLPRRRYKTKRDNYYDDEYSEHEKDDFSDDEFLND